MIAGWIVYGLLMGLLVAGAAYAVERALRLVGLPARGVWAGAILLTLLLMAAAPVRAGVAEAPASPAVTSVEAASLDHLVAASAPTSLVGWISRAYEALDAGLRSALTTTAGLVPAGFDRGVLIAWLLLSGSLASLAVWTYLLARRRLSGCPVHDVRGTRVRVAPEAGPALVGLLRPEVIVPRWFLHLSEDEQRLVLAHEEEHLRGADAWLLLLAACAAVILPWHPAAYWMLVRTRLAAELDCDARVLRGDVSAGAYGTLLIDLAARDSGFRLGAPAFAVGTSHLRRRLLAMKRTEPRFAAARGIALGALACLGLLAACEAELPTTAQIEELDVATAEAEARRVLVLGPEEADAQYTIDGLRVDAAEAQALAPERIARIEVVKTTGAEGEVARIRILTRAAGADAAPATGDGATPTMARLRLGGPDATDPADQPLLLVDGEQVDPGMLRGLSPDGIESIEVIKGPAATQNFQLPGAENGVIVITTKDAPTPGG